MHITLFSLQFQYLLYRYESVVVRNLGWLGNVVSSIIYSGLVLFGPAVMFEASEYSSAIISNTGHVLPKRTFLLSPARVFLSIYFKFAACLIFLFLLFRTNSDITQGNTRTICRYNVKMFSFKNHSGWCSKLDLHGHPRCDQYYLHWNCECQHTMFSHITFY